MPTVITYDRDPAGSVTPLLIDGYEATRSVLSRATQILGASGTIAALRPAGLRRGEMTLLFPTLADATAAQEKLLAPDVYTLTDESGPGVEVERSLSTNPNAVSATGFTSNNSASWIVTRNVAAPAGNPQGINIGAEGKIVTGVTTPSLVSIFNLDVLANTGPVRTVGAWVYVNASGYTAAVGSSTLAPIPANTWVWMTGSVAASTYAPARVSKASGNAAEADRAYITGVTAITTGTPVATIAGGVPYPSTASPDPDLTASWTGTPNASASILTKPSGEANPAVNMRFVVAGEGAESRVSLDDLTRKLGLLTIPFQELPS